MKITIKKLRRLIKEFVDLENKYAMETEEPETLYDVANYNTGEIVGEDLNINEAVELAIESSAGGNFWVSHEKTPTVYYT